MMKSRSKDQIDKWAKKVIPKISTIVHRTYPGGFVDEDDLSQAGWVCFCRCLKHKSINDDDFYTYTYKSIKRAIQQERLKSMGILYFPFNIRKICLYVHIRITKGESLPTILKDLGVSRQDWLCMKTMFDKHVPLDVKDNNNHLNLPEKQDLDFQLSLSDVFGLSCLSDLDRELIKFKIGQQSMVDQFSRTKRWQLARSLQTKLERCGYG